jgi:death-on-curing protein
VDGNKRLAWAACAVFLGLNGHRLHASQDEVVQLMVSVADGTLTDIDKIAERLAAWSKPAGV